MGEETAEVQLDSLLPEFKNTVHVLDHDDDVFMDHLLRAARASVKNAVGPKDAFYKVPENKSVYELAVLQLANNNWMQRGASTDVDLFDTRFGFQDMVLDLKASYALWELSN